MFGELDGESLERATVKASQEAFDDELGPEVEPCDLANHFRTKVFLSAHIQYCSVKLDWQSQTVSGANHQS
jgi:hypothetical protein